MVIFEKLRYKNILSTGDEFIEFDLDKIDLTLILGKNGGGKTTLIDALNFCLYGKPFRDINKDMLINSINGKKLLTEVEFRKGSDKYKCIRGIKPNVFEFYVNGILVPKDAKVVDYQKQVDKALSIGAKSFRSQVVLGSRTYVPFMRLKTEERRAVIEDLLDLEVFTTMNKVNRDNISDTEDELDAIDKELSKVAAKLELEKTRVSMVRGNMVESVDRLQRKIDALGRQKDIEEDSRKALQDELEALEPLVTGHHETAEKYAKYRSAKTSIVSNIVSIDENIDFYRDNDRCSTCLQTIDKNFKAEIIGRETTKKEGLQERIAKAEVFLEELKTELTRIESVERKMNEYRTSIAVKNSTIRGLQIQIDACEREITELERSTDDFDDIEATITKWQTAYNEGAAAKNDRATHLEYLKAVALVLKDTGLKAKIIKQYIPIMNTLINKYLGIMGFNVAFEINETFTETIKSQFKEAYSYGSFSEGEKMRLDLAIMFAWRDVAKMRNTTATNLLIMDEVLDASLDQEGAEDFLSIVREMAKDTNTIIISHKSEHLMDRFSKVIKFTKIKKFSKMKVMK